MKKSLAVAIVAAFPLLATAAVEPQIEFEPANVDLHNKASLQRGAALFVNNCMGCHSLQYMRWDRVGDDIGLSVELVQQFLQVTGDNPGDLMENSMPALDAAEWFGIPPPDLSLVARSRGTMGSPGTDWVYNFLLTFYVDESRPLGVNNLVFPDVAMPHALWNLQGMQRAVFDEHGAFESFEQVTEGSMSPEEYRRAARDITTFLAYIADPVQLEREALGTKVILFLLFFLVLAWLLKREYWKDVH
jgi:ubiquinol-cytochrome c reductase cytochrome c1 subunit